MLFKKSSSRNNFGNLQAFIFTFKINTQIVLILKNLLAKINRFKNRIVILLSLTDTLLFVRNPKPLIAEPLEPKDEDDGLAERMIPRTAHLIK